MSGRSGRVLVVDDSQIIRQLIKVILELDGFEVMTAVDGVECLETAARHRPDAITLDVVMPRLDGPRVAELLRRDPATRSIPLMLVSATPLDGHHAAGVDAVVSKPFEPAELVREVGRLCAASRVDGVRLAKSLAG